MDLNKYLKELQRLAAALRRLHAPKTPLSDHVRADRLEEALAAEKTLNLSELRPTLEQAAEDVRKRLPSLPMRSHTFRRCIMQPAIGLGMGCLVMPLAAAAVPAGNAQSGGTSPDQQDLASESVPRSAVVTRVASDVVTVDGLLNEEIWRTAPTIGALTQREPLTGEPPSEPTDVTLLYDDENLYIGVMAHDSAPQRVIGTQMARDASLNSDDRISIVLDTYRDQRNAFYFATNPSGALVDGLVFANGQSNMDWDAVWTVRTRRTSQGWSAEFAIPFKSLSFPAGRTVWGFNVARYIQRKLEEDRWSGALLQTQFFQVSEAGEITNLADLTQGIGLDLRPFAAGRWLNSGPNRDTAATGKPGLDMFYNFTPSLKLTATVNTDFGETEADARQINLSRFSLLFPEKRTFFLEDAGVFSFSNTRVRPLGGIPPTRSEVIPFLSRQIGLLSGEEVPLDLGVKLTGKIGRTDLGVLGVRTGDLPIVPGKTLFVGRVKRNILQESYVGAIFTEGNPALSIDSRTYGVDVRLGTSKFLGNQNLVFNAYGVRSKNAGIADDDASYGVTLEYPNDRHEVEFAWRDVQQNFRPALGFVSRRNVRLLRAGGGFGPRPKLMNLQQMGFAAYFTRFSRLDNGLTESWSLHLTPADLHFKSGDSLHSLFTPQSITYERLFVPFAIYPGVVLPAGEYRFTRFRTHFTSAAKRRLQGGIAWTIGNYWSGTARELTTSLTYKIPPGLTLSVNTNQTFARLPQGDFDATILGAEVNYSASPFVSLSNLLQYDNVSRNLGWQARVRWILQPGNDLFFVFGQGWIQEAFEDDRYQFRAQDSKLSAKFQYTFRL